ncbi:hypothetical protein AUG19_07930 [archaeon 13_1_20CM_2_54_9]|nr:MAG: hypothetical protein AUJ07_10260 [Crenarchaeota archaeon 13_1_40CM_3_53_5]OLE74843.1 MAG: hypothetical protein AUG19_07930 [archaeon 13_1_20CM_2_54_9]
MSDANALVVQLENLDVEYSGQIRALENVSLTIFEKDLVGLIGPNGAGKSTLISAVLGLVKPSHGAVRLFGESVSPQSLRRVGYVPQKTHSLDTNFPATVSETVLLGRIPGAGLFHRLTREDYRKTEEAMKLLGIEDLKDRKLGQLSGGQAQRVFIAKAIVDQPRLLILDEPTTGVDSHSRADFYSMLERLNHDLGITIILSSHDIGMVTKLASKVACLNRSLFFYGTPSELVGSPALSQLYDYPAEMMIHH